jgi:ubiquinone/menaquinone biosynthesis C-methylase UbiE
LHAEAFDELAADYDANFSDSALGRTLRSLVWARLEQAFRPPQRVLELGCGTGVDALSLARRGVEVFATDASAGMIEVARKKAQTLYAAGDTRRVEFHCVPMEHLASVLDGQLFDGVLSNFGAINCVQDLRALVFGTAACLRPGARLIWVVMGRHVPWEWAWFALQGHWSKACRRLSPGGVSWRGMNVRYPTPGELARLLQPYFKIERIAPLGVALPPSYAGEWLARQPRLSRILTQLEYRVQDCRALAGLADHYIVEATRLPPEARA